MVKCSILHASYGRPQQAYDTMRAWLKAADNRDQVEYIVCTDKNDPKYSEYLLLFSTKNLISLPGRTLMQAYNYLAQKASPEADLLITIADDLAPMQSWDTTLLKTMSGIDNFNDPKIIRICDGITPGSEGMVFFFNKAWVNRFGWFGFPGYTGVYSDNDDLEIAEKLGAQIKAPDLLFQHNHFTVGRSEADETYSKVNNIGEYEWGSLLFNARKDRGFDLGKPFLSIVTRHYYKRIEKLKKHIQSVISQNDNDYQHIIIEDFEGIGSHKANLMFSQNKEKVKGKYVFMLDDDDVLITPDFVKDIKRIAEENYFPEIIFIRMDRSEAEAPMIPTDLVWNEKKMHINHIGTSCFVVRGDVWMDNIHNFTAEQTGDFEFINSIYKTNPTTYWQDKVYSKCLSIGSVSGE
jgi:hypothetical protein